MALTYAPNVSLLVNNTAGAVQQLPPDTVVGGKIRQWTERITLNTAAIGDQIQIARLPYGSVPLDITLTTDTSLALTAFSIGDKNNTSRFAASGTFTTTNTRTSKINGTSVGVPLTTAYDNAGNVSTNFEDILITILTSSLIAGGTLTTTVEYMDYGV